MEKAVFISKIEDLKYAGKDYSRLYFGNEFCQRLIPGVEELRLIRDFTARNRMQFSLVTPYVTEEGVSRLRPVLGYVQKNFPQAEIIVNDWGVLRILCEEFHYPELALGRLLTKQKRGPLNRGLKGRIPQACLEHFKQSNVDDPGLGDFLIQKGIKRVELDNLLQGLNREGPVLKASLYYPFVYLTTTRFCLAASCESPRKFLRSIPACKRECRKYTFTLRHKNLPVEILLKGNTQFFKLERLPENLNALNIDRTVYEPQIPL
jgi:hypothetical protein